jgi:undecaprenyl-diphosphatase
VSIAIASDEIGLIEAAFLGAVEGLTEFLPVSSTGHLTILEKLFGHSIDDPDVTAFTAIIQVGAVLATVIYFRQDIGRIITGWLRGVFNPAHRDHLDYRFGWAVILGSIPIGVIGLTFKDTIETTLRSLWFVGSALILWSAVMWFADRAATQQRSEQDVTWKDTLIIGVAQCLALIPGISRSGATMSAGLLRDLDRVTVTRLSFFLSIPALVAAGILQTITKADDISDGVGWPATLMATAVSFVVAYAAVAWLLKFIAKHTYTVFIVYRLVLGSIVLLLVGTNTIEAT